MTVYDTASLREAINEMTGKHSSYYTIRVKFLYDNEAFKDEYRRAIEKTIDQYGRKFD